MHTLFLLAYYCAVDVYFRPKQLIRSFHVMLADLWSVTFYVVVVTFCSLHAFKPSVIRIFAFIIKGKQTGQNEPTESELSVMKLF